MSALPGKYVNPLTDFGFKKLFGTEPNKALIIDFLNQILPSAHQIEDLSYSRNEQVGQTEIDRKAIFDLYCISTSGERFIVEVQKAKQNFFKDRSIFYASFPIQEQSQKGGWNYQLAPVYMVGILDFIFDDHKEDENYLHLIELKNQDCKVFYEKLKFIYIELPKFKKTENELESQFDKWLYVFKHLAVLQNRPQRLQERIFGRLFEAAEIARLNPVEIDAYQQSLKHYWDLNNVMDTMREEGHKEGREKGRQEGRQEGRQKGRQEGRQEGRKEGRQEGRKNKSIEIAKSMKAAGEPVSKIALFTGLTEQEIDFL